MNPGDKPKRITFGGNYNARPRVSADGTQLAMVTLDNGNYRIAVQDLSSGTVRVLSQGHLDESPSFAPNGATLMYAEREGSRGALATVSVDGLTGLRLKAEQVRCASPPGGRLLIGASSSRVRVNKNAARRGRHFGERVYA